MDDLISRQDLFAEMKQMYHAAEEWRQEAAEINVKARAELLMDTLIEMKLRVEKMPSTQPEVVRCEDCKHGRPYKHTKEYVACEVDCEPIDRDSDFFCADGKRRE